MKYDKRIKCILHVPVKPYNKMSISEAMYELHALDNDIAKLNHEINAMKTSGSIATGQILVGADKREYVDNILESLDDLERKYSMVKTARNEANSRVRIEIDGKSMSLNKANTELESLRRQINRYTGYSGFQGVGNAPEYYDLHVEGRCHDKRDYYNRLKEVVNRANASEKIVIHW